MKDRRRKQISNLLLLVTALIWGIAFVAQSVGMEHVGPWTFVFFRYVLSALVLLPVALLIGKKNKKEREVSADRNDAVGTAVNKPSEYLKGGLLCGVFLGSASIAQQAGIQYTTTGKAGFITALYVILVPILGLVIGRKPEKKIWICVILGIAGLYLISVKGGFSIGSGDLLVILCAFLFACQILCVDHYSSRLENLVLLSVLQFVVSAVIGGIGMLLFEQPSADSILAAAVPILYAGVLSGAVGYTLQVIAQKHTEPAVASLLMSLESVFSALAGWVILGQALSARELAGCIFVFAAVILAELPLNMLLRKKKG